MNDPTIRTGSRKQKTVKHLIALGVVVVALLLAGEFKVRIPAAAWAGPAIVILLFVYGAWILLWLGPMRH